MVFAVKIVLGCDNINLKNWDDRGGVILAQKTGPFPKGPKVSCYVNLYTYVHV